MDIKYYTGYRIHESLKGLQKEVFLACWEYMHCAFGDNVEFERLSQQILLCGQTQELLYQKPNEPVRYSKGLRPILENIVSDICSNSKSDRERILSILCFVRDLYQKFDGEDFFYGGTEEDLIKKGEWFCERVSRLMVGLCEVAGYHGRIIFHVASGHLTCEVFIDDRWSYFDPRCGLFYVNESNQFLSVYELVNNRSYIYQQPDWVENYHSPYWSYRFRQHHNYHFCFNPLEIQCFGPYSLCDADKYHFEWRSRQKTMVECERIHNKYVELGKMALTGKDESL